MNCNARIVTGNSSALFTQLGVQCTADPAPWYRSFRFVSPSFSVGVYPLRTLFCFLFFVSGGERTSRRSHRRVVGAVAIAMDMSTYRALSRAPAPIPPLSACAGTKQEKTLLLRSSIRLLSVHGLITLTRPHADAMHRPRTSRR